MKLRCVVVLTTSLLVALAYTHSHSHGGHSHSHSHGGHSHNHGAHSHTHGGHEGHGHTHTQAGHSHSHAAASAPENKEQIKPSSETSLKPKNEVENQPIKPAVVQDALGANRKRDILEEHHIDNKHNNQEPRTKSEIWFWALSATAIVGCAPIVILFCVPISGSNTEGETRKLNVLLAFAVGGLLGDVFLHLLPHSGFYGGDDHGHHDHDEHGHDDHDEHGHDHSASLLVGLWILAGILSFFIIEKFVRSQHGSGGHSHNHGHSHGHKDDAAKKKPKKPEEPADKTDKSAKSGSTPSVASVSQTQTHLQVGGYLNLCADFSHNFTDGLALGASFLVSTKVGLITTFAILLHEVPHEIGDFAILIRSGFTKSQAMKAQLFTAIGAMIGTVIGLMLENASSLPAAQWILPFTAGGFIYVATTTVIPELLEDTTFFQTVKEIIAMAFGVFLMVLIVYIE